MLKLNFLKIFSKLFTIRTQTYIKFELIESLFLANFIAFSLVAEMYSYVPNKQGSPNKRAGWANFFVYYKKNNGEGVQIFSLLHEKQPVGWTIFQK